MYKGDSDVSNTHVYDLAGFQRTAAHEFGHTLGLNDADVASNPTSIMNTDYAVQNKDVEKVIKAFATKKTQNY